MINYDRKQSGTQTFISATATPKSDPTKLLGDGLVQLSSKNYLLCRCTHKPTPFPYDNAWIDQVGNFDYCTNISKNIISMVMDNVSGLYKVVTETKTI